ncbi:MAG: CRISPR system precrRNA processing endoribonuclease RAMP protein Cas6 [Campylobacterales bacterium]
MATVTLDPIRYINITTIVNINATPPPFIGSQLRGALGLALKQVVCINPSKQCQGCFASSDCLYYKWYEQRDGYHPYRLAITLNQKHYDFGLYLFEEACEALAYLLAAIERMITALGLGGERVKGTIASIRTDTKLLYDGRTFTIEGTTPTLFAPTPESHRYTVIETITPIRLKSDNRLVRAMPSLEAILTSIWHRYNELKGLPRSKLPFIPQGELRGSSGQFVELSRYSNRQQTKMFLGGVVGRLVYEGVDENSLMLLRLGEIIGVGKSTVFGLGQILVKEEK